MTPPRLPTPVLKTVARIADVPVIGRGVRALSIGAYGLVELRSARLGSTPPWVPMAPADSPTATAPRHEQQVEEHDRP